jgi:hypothetical protein
MSRLHDRKSQAGAVLVVAVAAVAGIVAAALPLVLALPVAAAVAFVAGMASAQPGHAWSRTSEGELPQTAETFVRQLRQTRKLSIQDPQTALLQRWYFELRIAEEARRCQRYGTTMAMLLLDLTQHDDQERPWLPGGEMDFVQVFARTLRSVDLAAKIDERLYAVCLPQTSKRGADIAFRRLLTQAPGYTIIPAMAICPRDGLDFDSLFAAAGVLDDEPALLRLDGAASVANIAAMLPELTSGEIQLAEGQTAAAAKSKIVRAAKRAGIRVRVWEEHGSVWFERTEVAAAEDVA